MDADEILVLQKGEIVERGNHHQLIEKGGVYKNLVERQLMSMQKETNEE
jgi:ABC-type transport system involved in Fe-S cluster assembly fused permease/ATPase subunit